MFSTQRSDVETQIQHYESQVILLKAELKNFSNNNFPKIESNSGHRSKFKSKKKRSQDQSIDYLTIEEILEVCLLTPYFPLLSDE
jgi:hypothetical protein